MKSLKKFLAYAMNIIGIALMIIGIIWMVLNWNTNFSYTSVDILGWHLFTAAISPFWLGFWTMMLGLVFIVAAFVFFPEESKEFWNSITEGLRSFAKAIGNAISGVTGGLIEGLTGLSASSWVWLIALGVGLYFISKSGDGASGQPQVVLSQPSWVEDERRKQQQQLQWERAKRQSTQRASSSDDYLGELDT